MALRLVLHVRLSWRTRLALGHAKHPDLIIDFMADSILWKYSLWGSADSKVEISVEIALTYITDYTLSINFLVYGNL